MKIFKRIIAMLTITGSLMALAPSAALALDNSATVAIDGFDCATTNGTVFVYPNPSDTDRSIGADEYGGETFRHTKLLVFDGSGKLIEAGSDLYANSTTVTGSPQLTVRIPAGGFMVAFFNSAPAALRNCFNAAMNGVMLYNSTMSVIHEAHASYSGNTLTIEYDNVKPASSNAKKFLFIGNSTTYFNGTPIKFKAMAEAAGVEVDVTYCTRGSAYLKYFVDESGADGDHYRALKNALAAKKYDYVVLQDAAKADYYVTKPAVEKLLPLIKENGAEALLYMRYSADYTFEGIRNNAIKHHTNYATIANDFGLVCSPVADAFVHCAEKYPEIPLYASDGGHHSKEGSYLIAATWLQSYLGINPVGNAYTADLPADVVAKLQECAKLACDVGYDYGIDTKDVYENGGVEYENIAKGKTYTVTGGVYSNPDWSDTGDDGKPRGKLTDGTLAINGSEGAIGCYLGRAAQPHSVTIDLGENYNVKHILTDLFGNESWGIPEPSTVKIKISVSDDGKTYRDLGEAEVSEASTAGEGWTKRLFTLTPSEQITAKYVKLSYSETSFVWASDIKVYGDIASATEESAGADDSESVTQNDEPSQDNGKKNSWIYWLLGAVAVAGATIAAIFISKKKK